MTDTMNAGRDIFINVNTSSSLSKRTRPFMAADRPPDLIARPQEFDAVKQNLLSTKQHQPVALRGSGGYGKTTLALMLCHDPEINKLFADGILWVTLGEKLVNVVDKIKDLISMLSNEQLNLASPETASAKLREALADGEYLLVIDDIWHSSDLTPFLVGGPRCTRLLTTRNEQVIPREASDIRVDAMLPHEAVQLLQIGLLPDATEKQFKPLFQQLAEQLGDWPLLLRLANGVLQQRVRRQESLPTALKYLQRALEERGVVAFDAKNSEARREKAVARTIDVSLELLAPEEVAHYQELAIFPEVVDIPLKTVQRLWQIKANFSEYDTDDLCSHLAELSLLLTCDLSTRSIRLHGVIRRYLQGVLKGPKRIQLQNAFLDTFHVKKWSQLSDDEPYLWEYLATHLIEAQRFDELATTLKDGSYLVKKIRLCGVNALENDLLQATSLQDIPVDHSLSLLQYNIRNMAHLLNIRQTEDEYIHLHEYINIVHSRLAHIPELAMVCHSLEQTHTSIIFTAQHPLPDLPPIELMRTLTGHEKWVNDCAISPDSSWLLSASDDTTLKIWDAGNGKERKKLAGHMSAVKTCAINSTGNQILSGDKDGIVKLWDVKTGNTLMTWHGPTQVNACAISPDGLWLLSAHNDGTLKRWDASSSQAISTFRAHIGRVHGCAISSDSSWILSAADDFSLKLWDCSSGQVRRTLHGKNGHIGSVNDCAISPDDSWILSASSDGTLKRWDTATGQVIQTFQGHKDKVNACAISSDSTWVLSASDDTTLKLWDAISGKELMTLQGHDDWVRACAISSDGTWVLSASDDQRLKMWNVSSKKQYRPLDGHKKGVNDCTTSSHGSWALSASKDKTLKIWDAKSGTVQMTLDGHDGSVNGCAISPDNSWILSASNDTHLKIWDSATGHVLHTLHGHKSGVNSCAISPDGSWLLSASDDASLKIWDASSGHVLHTLYGHEKRVRDCAISPDGSWLLSASDDASLKIWDASSGQVIYTLQGHKESVQSCAISPDGSWLLSASNDTALKIWDASSGQVIYTLQGHKESVRACAISPDGSWFLSASNDKTLKLWDVAQRICITTMHIDSAPSSVALLSDGKHIVTGGSKGMYFLKLINNLQSDTKGR